MKRIMAMLLATLAVASASYAGLVGMSGPKYALPTEQAAAQQPANYDLELVSPRQAGTAPSAESGTPNFPSGHRVLKAYPGLEYNIKAVIIGGSYPYSCSLSGGVEWLSVNESTCVISGTAPVVADGTMYTPTLTVEDAEGTEETEPWTITVTTAGFKFVDSVNDGSGDTGTAAAPYDSFGQLMSGSSAGDLVYFRTGTYNVTDISPTACTTGPCYVGYNNPTGNWRRAELNSSSRGLIWIAYPGETPILDGGYSAGVEQGFFLRLNASATAPIYVDGLELRNFYHMALQVGTGGSYNTFRRLNAHDIKNSFNGANSSVIDSISQVGTAPRFYVSYTENYFHDNASGSMKLYWHYKTLSADNVHEGNLAGADSGATNFAGGPDHKGVVARWEVRNNVFELCPSTGVVSDANGAERDAGFGGNMNYVDGDTPAPTSQEQGSGEVRYNKFGCFSRPGLRVVDMNNFANAGEIFIYRNTGVGRWNVQCSDNGTGPFHIYDNIIVNDVGAANTDRITFSLGNCAGIGTGTLIDYGAGDDINLVYSVAGAEDIVIDSDTLDLIGASLSHLGSKGAQLQ